MQTDPETIRDYVTRQLAAALVAGEIVYVHERALYETVRAVEFAVSYDPHGDLSVDTDSHGVPLYYEGYLRRASIVAKMAVEAGLL